MTTQDLIDYFGNAYRFAKATSLTPHKMTAQSFHNWVKAGRIPKPSQLLIEKITNGELKAEWKNEN